MRWTLFIKKIGLSESKRAPIWRTAKLKTKPYNVSLCAKKKLHSVYSQCYRNTAIRISPSHMPAAQTIGLRLPCNCIPVQTGIRDMGTREIQLLQYTAKCFLHLSVPSSITCSVTEICTLVVLMLTVLEETEAWSNISHSSNIWTKANGM